MPKTKGRDVLQFAVLFVLAVLFLSPILIVLMNSFKGKFFISDTPFQFPNGQTFVNLKNYTEGVVKTGFFNAFGMSLFITVCSVAVIVLLTAMTAWYITRVKTRFTKLMYYVFVFSMIVPFQMVMFTMTKT
ncbi:MAG: carbohydrate ABC transporter permease, partial [Paenibacillus macerans]|nr:carbohydrate ABC transporter permease [Paenibacillus macerans]